MKELIIQEYIVIDAILFLLSIMKAFNIAGNITFDQIKFIQKY